MSGKETSLDIQVLLQRRRAELRLDILSNFGEIADIQIPLPPSKKTLFPGSDDEYWYEVDKANHASTTCICELSPNSKFGTHYHKTSKEVIELLTPGSYVEVVTEDNIKYYNYPSVIVVPKNVKHAVINHSGFKITCKVIWSPEVHGEYIRYPDKNAQ
jgi:hypothetical protein